MVDPYVAAEGATTSGTYFTVLDEDDAGAGRYLADAASAGPWDERLQHGGPPSALLVRAAERAAHAASGRTDLHALRFAAEFVGPVPVAEVTTQAQVVRIARSGVLVATEIRADGRDGVPRPCLQARVWLVRELDTSDVAHPFGKLTPPPARSDDPGDWFAYGRSVEWRPEQGSFHAPGPAVIWARPRRTVVAGEQPSGLGRAVLVGDSASGVSSELDWTTWSFLNVDLDVHLARPVHGEWLRIDGRTQLGAHGSALARSTLSDERGVVGATMQTLVVSAR